jgi:predicted CxxxxCH...CXXCH cytochrome family protein
MRNKEYQKAWKKANAEKIRATNRAWDKNNPEKIVAKYERYFLKLNLANKDISRRTLKAWSCQIRERDCSCLYCGSTSKLQAHHILSKSKHPDWALFLNNGITLCESCHTQEHTINGDL